MGPPHDVRHGMARIRCRRATYRGAPTKHLDESDGARLAASPSSR